MAFDGGQPPPCVVNLSCITKDKLRLYARASSLLTEIELTVANANDAANFVRDVEAIMGVARSNDDASCLGAYILPGAPSGRYTGKHGFA